MFEFFLRKTREGRYIAYGFRATGKPPVTVEGLRIALEFHGRQWETLNEAVEDLSRAGFQFIL